MSNTFTLDSTYALKLGDLGPPISPTLKQSVNGSSVTPFAFAAGDVATLRYDDPNGAEHEVTMTFTVGGSVASYSWQDGDLPVVGLYKGEVRVVRAGEDFPQTFPATGEITWRVNEPIDGTTPTTYGTLALLDVPTYYATGSEGVGVAITINTPQSMAQTDYKVFALDRGADRYEFSVPLAEQTSTAFAMYFATQPPVGTPYQFAILGRTM